MANKTDEHALHAHGSDPQHLLSPTIRNAVYSCVFWNRTCFGINLADLVHVSVRLRSISGMNLVNRRPSAFLCLLLKLLQLSPEMDRISVFLEQTEFKYPRILAAFYIRLVDNPINIYTKLEPLLSDCRRIVIEPDPAIDSASIPSLSSPSLLSTNNPSPSFTLVYVDMIIDALLRSTELFGIPLPRIPTRPLLVETNQLDSRKSSLVL